MCVSLISPACRRERDRPALQADAGTYQPWGEATISAKDRNDIKVRLNQLTAALKGSDSSAAAALFDPKRMAAVMKNSSATRLTSADVRGLNATFAQAMRSAMVNLISMGYWDRYDARSVMMSDDNRDAVVLIRAWTTDGVGVGVRLWMSKDGGEWSFYDYEEQGIGLSILDSCRIAIDSGAADQPATLAAVRVLPQVAGAMGAQDHDEAERLLESIASTPMPPAFDGVRWMWTGMLRTAQERYDEALVALDRASSLKPDFPFLHYLRASALNEMGRHAEALAEAQAYQSYVGDDAGGCYEMGVSLIELDRKAEAVDAFRRGLADTPVDPDLLWGLGRALPASEMAELGTRFRKLSDEDSESAFRLLCVLFENSGNDAAIDALVAAQSERAPNNVDVLRIDARRRMRRSQWKEASDILSKAIGLAGEEDIRASSLRALYYEAMVEQGKEREAVERMPDTASAYHDVASLLAWDIGDGNTEAIGRLTALNAWYAESHESDAWAAYFQASVHHANGDEDAAIAAFARAHQLATDPQTAAMIAPAWRVSMYEAGRIDEAYDTIPPQRDTFDELGMYLFAAEKYDAIRALIKRHRERHPDDTEIQFYEVEMAAAENRHEAALEILTTHRDALVGRSLGPWWFHYARLRSLIGLSRFDEARIAAKEFEPVDDVNDPQFNQLWIAAAEGNVASAIAAFDALVAGEYFSMALYEDEDLGPHLMSEAMAPLREKYPPSSENDASESE
ncbi:MAG TPA: tetratricopeptide repeat protein [Phycisphaerae bacterium]|nr:tetratricopeptide repeat protein [Phycisphaerae bacterium]